MKLDIEKFIAWCGPCIEFQDCRPFEEEIAREEPITELMIWLGLDIFYFQGSNYLFVVDGFLQYCLYYKFGPSPTSLQVVKVLRNLFISFGYPKQIRVDVMKAYNPISNLTA